jgi:hypothetical protein
MENPICDMQTLYSPNRRYANTVNLVFFRAVPLTKNFQKYVDGLKSWKNYIKYYPECQLQVFVDEHVLKEESVRKLLEELSARIILFKCPDFIIQDNYHLGLFATMVRFYPIFDVNTHALKVAHIQELEPDQDFVPIFEDLHKLGSMNHDASLIYTSSKLYSRDFASEHLKYENSICYPWIIAGRFSVYEKVPFKLFSNYLEDIEKGKKFYNIYENQVQNKKSEHGKYTFGIDEMFLNHPYIEYLIKEGKTIGLLTRYKISYPVYHLLDNVTKNSKSINILQYILNKKGNLKQLLKDFDTLFYSNYKSERAVECGKRFYEVLEKYPSWLGKYESSVILKFFKGYLYRNCLVLIKNNTIIDIKDL